MEATRNFQDTLIIPSAAMVNSVKAPANGLSAQSEGLMRYHSAPSSTFASLLASEFYLASEAADPVQLMAHNGLNNFGGFCDGGLPLEPNQKQSCHAKDGQQLHSGQNAVLLQYSGRGDVVFEDHIGQGHLSAILEHASEVACVPQPCQGNPGASTSNGATCDSDNQYKSNLIRHSSLPAHLLSRLALADVSERPMGSHQASSSVQSSCQHMNSHIESLSPRTADNMGGKVYVVSSRMSPGGLPVRKCLAVDGVACKKEEYNALDSESNQGCGLLRQSSSPAGLFSQLSLDELASPTEKAVTPTQNLALGGWDEASMAFAMQKIAALSQRKRGRDIEARSIKSLSAADPVMDQITSPRNHDSAMGASNGDMNDAVLCKSRAKRGCATHPRSIAERVRRTKINERIKKLLELVPNLDKQAHTADMLDEVVEYVKLLQQKVEELSNQSHECNGTCQKKGDQCC